MDIAIAPPRPRVHPQAAVDPKARLGAGVEIGPFCVVGPEVEIGEETVLLARVLVSGRVRIGRRNVFHPTSVVGGPPQDEKRREAADGRIEIGDENLFREATTVHAPKIAGGVTRIGAHGRFLFGSHVGHDAELGDSVTLGGCFAVGGHARIADHGSFGPLGAIHQFASAGRYCASTSHTPITQDAPPFMRIGGNHYDVLGVNVAALRRDGFPEETIAALEDACEIIWRRGLPRSESLPLLAESSVSEVCEVVRFLRSAAGGWMGRAREAER